MMFVVAMAALGSAGYVAFATLFPSDVVYRSNFWVEVAGYRIEGSSPFFWVVLGSVLVAIFAVPAIVIWLIIGAIRPRDSLQS